MLVNAGAYLKHFEQAGLLLQIGRFSQAIGLLEEGKEVAARDKNWKEYCRCVSRLIRVYAEKQDFESVQYLKAEVIEFRRKYTSVTNAYFYYTLGICSIYLGRIEEGEPFFTTAISQAQDEGNSHSLGLALLGMAYVHFHSRRFDQFCRNIRDIENITVKVDAPDLQIPCSIVKSKFMVEQNRHLEALAILEDAQKTLREHHDYFLFLMVMYQVACVHYHLKNNEIAEYHFRIVKNLINPDYIKILGAQVDHWLKVLAENSKPDYDLLIYMGARPEVVEKSKGRIRFKRQFLLLNMLRMFVENKGEVLSKEHLVRKVWNELYDPVVHDNKLYVTIQRLRKLIEQDHRKPQYILKGQGGYYLNDAARIKIA